MGVKINWKLDTPDILLEYIWSFIFYLEGDNVDSIVIHEHYAKMQFYSCSCTVNTIMKKASS